MLIGGATAWPSLLPVHWWVGPGPSTTVCAAQGACGWCWLGPSELAACLVGGGWGQGRCQTTSGQDRVPTVVGYAALTRRGAGDG